MMDTMNPDSRPEATLSRVPRRIPKACKKCRATKIKCSGNQPCDRCVRRNESCEFPSREPQVLVQERYLRQLQECLRNAETTQAQGDQTHSQSQAEPEPEPEPFSQPQFQPQPQSGTVSQMQTHVNDPSTLRPSTELAARQTSSSQGQPSPFEGLLVPSSSQVRADHPQAASTNFLGDRVLSAHGTPLQSGPVPRPEVRTESDHRGATLSSADVAGLSGPGPTDTASRATPADGTSSDRSCRIGVGGWPSSHSSTLCQETHVDFRVANASSSSGRPNFQPKNSIRPDEPADDRPIPHNPLLSKNSAYVRDSSGNPRFLGPSSTWSFCRRALLILEAHSPSSDGSTAPLNLDGAAFRMHWSTKAEPDESDLEDLPPADYAMYLYNTVKFHLADLFAIIDEGFFLDNFQRFHKNPLEIMKSQRLWFVEYLLLVAYGQAFLASGNLNGNNAPPGSPLAARAISLLPDPAIMHDEPVQGAEVLALVSLFLHSIDMRAAAFQYIGQALRLAYIAGIHRQMSDVVGDTGFADRCNNLWWGVYVLDQELSAGMGAPSAVPEDYACPDLPIQRSDSLISGVLTLRIHLSKLIASICSMVYGAEEHMGDTFMQNTTNVLHKLADISRKYDDITAKFGTASRSYLPHMFTQVTLLFHYCIILATRPLVMWLLNLKIAMPTEPQRLEGPVAALLQKSAQSAATTVAVLRHLAEQKTLNTFLPFQLDYNFSSAMLLSILSAISPSYIPDTNWQESVNMVLDEMVRRQNSVARLRVSELEQLDMLLGPLRTFPSQVPSLSTICRDQEAPVVEDSIQKGQAPSQITGLYGGEDIFMTDMDQILELADQLQHGNYTDPLLFDMGTLQGHS